MRVQTEEWRRFIPGVRMYKGKMTLFYNGEKLWEGIGYNGHPLIYNQEERQTWEVIIVLPGVEIIPDHTFRRCMNVKTVIMSDTVRRIEGDSFSRCRSLEFVKFSRNLVYIGNEAFCDCGSLTSIFIPPSCQEIGRNAFWDCTKLIILRVPQNTRIDDLIIADTALFKASPFTGYEWIEYVDANEVNAWIKNLHADNQFSLHRACASFNPLEEVIFNIVQRQGIGAFKKPDSLGITASQYLSENPFTEIKERNIIKRYILDMMGEVV